MHTRVSTNLEFFEVANEPIVWDMYLLNMQMTSAIPKNTRISGPWLHSSLSLDEYRRM